MESVDYTNGFLLGDEKRVNDFIASVPAIVKQPNLTVEFVPRGSQGPAPSKELFPVGILAEPPSTFPTLDYFNNLQTKDLGRLLIYTELITSTMNVFGGESLRNGLVVIARQQTKGRGRDGTDWVSPVGCAMSTTQLNAQMDSQIALRLPLIQLLAALSVVLSVPNHKDINLRVKWPNDIYLGDKKIGGVLVESNLEGNDARIAIGVGVNVSNEQPTVCLNSVLGEGSKFSCASLIAKSLSHLEVLLGRVEGGEGELDQVLATYTDNWVHSLEDTVHVKGSDGEYTEGKISGVDKFGGLQVVEINSGKVTSVSPDGKSFDIANKVKVITNKK